jgi:hypothetical protein
MTGQSLPTISARAFKLKLQPVVSSDSNDMQNSNMWRRYRLAACAMLLSVGSAHAQLTPNNCGPLSNAYGPFDYRTTRGEELSVVERFHFTPEMESLVRGKGKNLVGGDLDYTLRAFPNHHRALLAMMRLGEREKATKTGGAGYEVECYFVRAVTFKPDDVVSRMLFAKFLLNAKRRDEALRQLALAQPHARDNPFSQYNLGLSFLEAEQYDEALKHAHQAMALGFPRTELRDQLQAKGHWQEPTAASSDAVTPLAPASAAPSAAGPDRPASAP